MPTPTKFKPTNLATCYDGERVYFKDLPTGRMFANKDCTLEISKEENDAMSKQEAAAAAARVPGQVK